MSHHKPWVSLLLYLVMLNTFVLMAGAYASFMGNTKIYPRVFFGVFATAIPLLLLLGIVNLLQGTWGSIYRRVAWDLVLLIFTLGISLVFCAVLGLRHVRLHGNAAGAMPFETPDDLGSTFLSAHFAIFATSFFVFMADARAILSYALDAYPLTSARAPSWLG